eukprot:4358339-Pleurochrysis_carterae.AAC.1
MTSFNCREDYSSSNKPVVAHGAAQKLRLLRHTIKNILYSKQALKITIICKQSSADVLLTAHRCTRTSPVLVKESYNAM